MGRYQPACFLRAGVKSDGPYRYRRGLSPKPSEKELMADVQVRSLNTGTRGICVSDLPQKCLEATDVMDLKRVFTSESERESLVIMTLTSRGGTPHPTEQAPSSLLMFLPFISPKSPLTPHFSILSSPLQSPRH
ncbi:unnamed protein product [Pleuronectes platessa]|uniref:Uncharacterized protein n=1 Tax=Pleuronectes platessa TaxID=8262 RepID=A0A9N7ULM3_PLEPL|nr:unnamed protein product [Pleuronectes platessa]